MTILVWSIELDGLFRGCLARNKMDSARQMSWEIGPFNAASLQSVELQFFGFYGVIKISIQHLGSLQITSFGIIKVKILILSIGKDGGEVLI